MKKGMTTSELKEIIHQKIDSITEVSKLEVLYELLINDLDPVLKDKLTTRALKSNQDIEEGKVYTRKEAENRIKSKIKSDS